MFKNLLNETRVVADINEFEGKITERVSSLVDIFEARCFDHELETYIQKNKMTVIEQVEFMKELTDRQDVTFDVLKEQELTPETQAIIMELGGIQKKIKSLKAKMADLEATKKELSPEVIAALEKLDLQNIRIEKVLVSLYRGKTVASFNKVMDAIENQLTPAVSKLLRSTYDNLSVEREPTLMIKTEGVSEGDGGFFGRTFNELVDLVSNSLSKIEGMLGINEEEELDPHDIEKNKPGPVVMGLG